MGTEDDPFRGSYEFSRGEFADAVAGGACGQVSNLPMLPSGARIDPTGPYAGFSQLQLDVFLLTGDNPDLTDEQAEQAEQAVLLAAATPGLTNAQAAQAVLFAARTQPPGVMIDTYQIPPLTNEQAAEAVLLAANNPNAPTTEEAARLLFSFEEHVGPIGQPLANLNNAQIEDVMRLCEEVSPVDLPMDVITTYIAPPPQISWRNSVGDESFEATSFFPDEGLWPPWLPGVPAIFLSDLNPFWESITSNLTSICGVCRTLASWGFHSRPPVSSAACLGYSDHKRTLAGSAFALAFGFTG